MTEYWRSPNGKMIPFEVERIQVLVSNDDFNVWFVEISKFPKNTSINIISYSGMDGFDGGTPEVSVHVRRWQKMPHAEFKKQRDQLIAEGTKIIKRLVGDELSEY